MEEEEEAKLPRSKWVVCWASRRLWSSNFILGSFLRVPDRPVILVDTGIVPKEGR
jgi:hypothetical protein